MAGAHQLRLLRRRGGRRARLHHRLGRGPRVADDGRHRAGPRPRRGDRRGAVGPGVAHLLPHADVLVRDRPARDADRRRRPRVRGRRRRRPLLPRRRDRRHPVGEALHRRLRQLHPDLGRGQRPHRRRRPGDHGGRRRAGRPRDGVRQADRRRDLARPRRGRRDGLRPADHHRGGRRPAARRLARGGAGVARPRERGGVLAGGMGGRRRHVRRDPRGQRQLPAGDPVLPRLDDDGAEPGPARRDPAVARPEPERAARGNRRPPRDDHDTADRGRLLLRGRQLRRAAGGSTPAPASGCG